MGLRVPKNKIQEGKYTSGGEYMVESTNAMYKGYYYVFNNEAYVGKEYDSKALKLIPIKNRNKLLNKGKSLAIFSLLTGITSQALQTPNFSSLPNNPSTTGGIETLKFYCKKINDQSSIIKEIDEINYKLLQNNSLYQVTYIGTYLGITQTIDMADKQLPGLKIYIANSSYSPGVDD
jgi:hypothetical protein